MYFLAKLLQAFGIGSLGIAVVRGIYGDIRFEYYLFFSGVALFLIGRQLEKRWERKNAPKNASRRNDDAVSE